MTLDHEVDVLEHQFARKAVRDHHRHRALPRPAPHRGHLGRRRHPRVRGRAHPDRRRHPSAPARRRAVRRHHILDSDEIVEIPRLPRSLTVIGAGVIGMEYATIFSALDVAVTLVEARPTMLDFIDREMIEDFIHQLRDRGVTLRLGAKVERHRRRERLAGHHPGRMAAASAPRCCCTPPAASARPMR